ncbi:ABC transporter ATP-binding protein [Demequina sp. SYSU T00039]|uniref:ABC transporter ATP-binding protein n=1 Tax=Demequina lignilytica TaxID=3051663 RepID=A0AAW7M9K1_9MICO|nr:MULTISPECIES: ABC transporter ATP-binding protein [unclassified Demequina]MDN4479286.1 ABC transporter ATP-binding protein [Demequina sp. SYSU T00039-1]MDN4488745.1 ABC transporter ATP-binding protein [Demequina sp. SYSU T00039]
MTAIIETEGLTRRYGDVHAVEDVTLRVEEGSVYGLLGRNGAGKTTLLQLLTGQEFATSGEARLFGERSLENPRVLGRTCLVKESQSYPDNVRGHHVLRAASWSYAHWDQDYAIRLADDLRVPLGRRVKKMSRGQRSAVGAIVGLASRAELTLFDEPYAGLDAVARQVFYDALLADLAEHPRTVVMSTHLIDEASPLLDRVVVIDEGRIVIDAEADALRGTAVTVVGRAQDVDAFVSGRDVLRRDRIGGISSATVADVDHAARAAATAAGLELAPVSLQELVVARTGGARGRKDPS